MKRKPALAGWGLILVTFLGLAAIRADRLPAAPWAQSQLDRLKTRFVESSGRAWFICEDFAATISYRMHRMSVATATSRDGASHQVPARDLPPVSSLTDVDS